MEVDEEYLWALETLAISGPGKGITRSDYKRARRIVENREPMTDIRRNT